uniref:Uncharacterized protein n=1 Tax=Heterosigma akashiwo TaxID=2829 RepID=A0A6V1PWD1_HETAK|mmetsp:Transcript_13490/g.21124  ORF Transcript_13490/g.21124 Transcript_13490/m.21124 type:complete len:185 (-) Transcript_13490:137-691(-)
MADVEKKEAPPGEVKESQGVENREKQVSKMAAEMTGIPDGKAPSKQGSKEGIRSPQARQMEAAQYKPLIIEVKNNPCMCCPAKCGCTKECIIPIGCGNTFEDLVIIFSLLGTLWCGLLGFYTLLLKAQIVSVFPFTILLSGYECCSMFWVVVCFVRLCSPSNEIINVFVLHIVVMKNSYTYIAC